MTGRRCRNFNSVEFLLIPPVHLNHFFRIHAPVDQPLAHAERRKIFKITVGQSQDRIFVQVIEVRVQGDVPGTYGSPATTHDLRLRFDFDVPE